MTIFSNLIRVTFWTVNFHVFSEASANGKISSLILNHPATVQCPLLWTLGLRYIQGRQLLARMGKRTLVVGDLPWVHQLLKSYVSKLFSLSYGIASLEIHGANPQDQMLHHFGHRVVRGTLIYLGVPDGRRGKIQKQEESATIMTGKQANGIRNLGAGPEIVAVGHNPAIARQDFCEIFSRLFVKSLFLGGKR
jgi:hypothetical protein